MPFQELGPAHTRLVSFGRRVAVMAAQDVAPRDFVEVMPEIGQGALHAAIASCGMLCRHAHDELRRFLGDPGSAKPFAFRATAKLFGNQACVPAHEGIECGNGSGVFELFAAQRTGERRESAAFSVMQAQPTSWELGCEHPIFFFEGHDDVLLMPIEPAGDRGDEALEYHDGSSG